MGNSSCHCNIDPKHQTQEINFLKDINKNETSSPSSFHGNAYKVSPKQIDRDNVAVAYHSSINQGVQGYRDIA